MADRGDISATEHARLRHWHVGRYVVVWIALLVFTALTYGVSRFHIPGGWGVTVALAIAIVKGGLVALFFMHLWDQRGANRLVFVTSLLFVALLIGGVISDNATRFALTNPPGTEGAAPLRPTDYEILERKPPQAAPRPH